MIPDSVIIILGSIIGFCFVYYLILKLASNGWIGEIPGCPVPSLPLFGCLSVYLRTVDLNELIEKSFGDCGWIFQLRCMRQKIVFIEDHQVLSDAMEMKQIKFTTISELATALHRLGLKYIKRRELVFLTKVWQKHVHQFYKEKNHDVQLMNLIADKIFEEDTLESIEQGELTSPPQKMHQVRMDESDPKPCPDTIENLRCILLQCPHLWIGSKLFYFLNWRQHKIKRLKGNYLFTEVKEYVEDCLRLCNIFTEKKFLLFMFILIKMSSLQSLTKTEHALGPDIGGWRAFVCQEYAEVKQYKIPKKSLIFSK